MKRLRRQPRRQRSVNNLPQASATVAFRDVAETIDFADVVTLISGQHVEAADCNKAGVGVPYLTGPSDFPYGEIVVTKFMSIPIGLCASNAIFLITVKGFRRR